MSMTMGMDFSFLQVFTPRFSAMRPDMAADVTLQGQSMPELPEVETVVKALNAAIAGRVIAGIRFLGRMRLPFDVGEATLALAGKKILGVRRRAKYMIIDCDGQRALLAHLGMTGYFHVDSAAAEPEKHDRVIFAFADGEELRYADARRFGFVKLTDLPHYGGLPPELGGLGPEPLGRGFTGGRMLERAKGRKCPVKTFIMDQAIVVGVGNIYASEALFAAGVDPRRPAATLNLSEWERVVAEIKATLRRAIRKGGSTIRNYRTVDGTEGGFQRVLKVYGRSGEGCRACGETIQTVRQGGRSTFFCPDCQR